MIGRPFGASITRLSLKVVTRPPRGNSAKGLSLGPLTHRSEEEEKEEEEDEEHLTKPPPRQRGRFCAIIQHFEQLRAYDEEL